MELRQNTLAVRATALNDLASGARELLLTLGTDANAVRGRMEWMTGEAMDPVDQAMAEWTLLALLRSVENVFLQVQAGAVDDGALERYGFRVVANSPYLSPRFPSWWAGVRSTFDANFVAAFEGANGLAP
jgi:hypothetical protein